MQPETKIHLYIKHAVGSRMLFDVSATGKPFNLIEAAGRWTFTIEDVEPATAAVLQENAAELNIFYFVEQPGQPIRKSWLYDQDCPDIDYTSDTRRCIISVDTKMEYSNNSV